ncbi:MAG: M3 family oligoendopeptidase, partial [Cryomorphaceae bacterium]|nr:M3 family oligoendopeptidase [Cryomorphaceae bacterium]
MELKKQARTFMTEGLVIDSWETIKKYFVDLSEREIQSSEDLVKWLQDRSELDAVLEEDAAWRYIRMTIDTRDESLSNAYTFFVTKIQPELAPYDDILNRKLVDCQFTNELKSDPAYAIYFKAVETALEIFREENIPLEAELNEKSQLFGSISAAQSIEHEGAQITMQKASALLKETDESLRRTVFDKMSVRRREDTQKLHDLFTELIEKRHHLSVNAGFENFRDYKFKALNRFDYTKEDCFNFHQSVKDLIVPIVREIQQERLSKLGKNAFKPWDTEVDPEGKAPLKPFENGDEMLTGTIAMFHQIDTYFGECLEKMDEMGHLDLDSKAGKAPGGYNYPLYEIGVPFIFMNAVGAQRDLVTMVHEGGHAVHSFLSRDLALTGFKNLPSEVAELASMSMELLTMHLWSEFYKDENNLNRAKKEQLETVLKILPWIAQIDEFQHWVYENPSHTITDRDAKWLELSKAYGTGLTDWTGYEDQLATSWQRQMHLFEVPFYYIEYGIA